MGNVKDSRLKQDIRQVSGDHSRGCQEFFESGTERDDRISTGRRQDYPDQRSLGSF